MADNVDSATTDTTESQSSDTSAGSENTSSHDDKKPVPFDRFNKVYDERKAYKEERDALAQEMKDMRAKLDQATTARSEPKAPGDLPMPPSGLSERENARWLIENDVDGYLARKFGMPLEDVTRVLQSVPEVSRTASLTQWESLCSTHKLDPNDSATRDMFTGLSLAAEQRGDKTNPEKIVKRIVELRGTSASSEPPKNPPGPHSVEKDGVSRAVTVEDFIPGNAKEASEGAASGKRAPDISSDEVFQRRKRARK